MMATDIVTEKLQRVVANAPSKGRIRMNFSFTLPLKIGFI